MSLLIMIAFNNLKKITELYKTLIYDCGKSPFMYLTLTYISKYNLADINTNGIRYIQKEDVAKLLRNLTSRFQFKVSNDTRSVLTIIETRRKSKCTGKTIHCSKLSD